MNMNRIASLGLIFFTLLFANCSSDNEDAGNKNVNSVSATINGVNWKPTKINSVAFMKVKGMDQLLEIVVQDDTQILTLFCTSKSTAVNAMPLKEYNFILKDPMKEALLIPLESFFTNKYLIEGNTYAEYETTIGKITITAMDPVKRKVSGTFSFKASKVDVLQNKIVTPENYEIKNGRFTNLSYTVTVEDYKN